MSITIKHNSAYHPHILTLVSNLDHDETIALNDSKDSNNTAVSADDSTLVGTNFSCNLCRSVIAHKNNDKNANNQLSNTNNSINIAGYKYRCEECNIDICVNCIYKELNIHNTILNNSKQYFTEYNKNTNKNYIQAPLLGIKDKDDKITTNLMITSVDNNTPITCNQCGLSSKSTTTNNHSSIIVFQDDKKTMTSCINCILSNKNKATIVTIDNTSNCKLDSNDIHYFSSYHRHLLRLLNDNSFLPDKFKCNICARLIENSEDNSEIKSNSTTPRFYCLLCDFSICALCSAEETEKNKKLLNIYTERHPKHNSIPLTSTCYSSGDWASTGSANTFVCNLCNQSKKAPNFHCAVDKFGTACNYDICLDCIIMGSNKEKQFKLINKGKNKKDINNLKIQIYNKINKQREEYIAEKKILWEKEQKTMLDELEKKKLSHNNYMKKYYDWINKSNSFKAVEFKGCNVKSLKTEDTMKYWSILNGNDDSWLSIQLPLNEDKQQRLVLATSANWCTRSITIDLKEYGFTDKQLENGPAIYISSLFIGGGKNYNDLYRFTVKLMDEYDSFATFDSGKLTASDKFKTVEHLFANYSLRGKLKSIYIEDSAMDAEQQNGWKGTRIANITLKVQTDEKNSPLEAKEATDEEMYIDLYDHQEHVEEPDFSDGFANDEILYVPYDEEETGYEDNDEEQSDHDDDNEANEAVEEQEEKKEEKKEDEVKDQNEASDNETDKPTDSYEEYVDASKLQLKFVSQVSVPSIPCINSQLKLDEHELFNRTLIEGKDANIIKLIVVNTGYFDQTQHKIIPVPISINVGELAEKIYQAMKPMKTTITAANDNDKDKDNVEDKENQDKANNGNKKQTTDDKKSKNVPVTNGKTKVADSYSVDNKRSSINDIKIEIDKIKKTEIELNRIEEAEQKSHQRRKSIQVSINKGNNKVQSYNPKDYKGIDMTSIPEPYRCNNILLLVNGNILENNRTLLYYKLTNNTVVYLIEQSQYSRPQHYKLLYMNPNNNYYNVYIREFETNSFISIQVKPNTTIKQVKQVAIRQTQGNKLLIEANNQSSNTNEVLSPTSPNTEINNNNVISPNLLLTDNIINEYVLLHHGRITLNDDELELINIEPGEVLTLIQIKKQQNNADNNKLDQRYHSDLAKSKQITDNFYANNSDETHDGSQLLMMNINNVTQRSTRLDLEAFHMQIREDIDSIIFDKRYTNNLKRFFLYLDKDHSGVLEPQEAKLGIHTILELARKLKPQFPSDSNNYNVTMDPNDQNYIFNRFPYLPATAPINRAVNYYEFLSLLSDTLLEQVKIFYYSYYYPQLINSSTNTYNATFNGAAIRSNIYYNVLQLVIKQTLEYELLIFDRMKDNADVIMSGLYAALVSSVLLLFYPFSFITDAFKWFRAYVKFAGLTWARSIMWFIIGIFLLGFWLIGTSVYYVPLAQVIIFHLIGTKQVTILEAWIPFSIFILLMILKWRNGVDSALGQGAVQTNKVELSWNAAKLLLLEMQSQPINLKNSLRMTKKKKKNKNKASINENNKNNVYLPPRARIGISNKILDHNTSDPFERDTLGKREYGLIFLISVIQALFCGVYRVIDNSKTKYETELTFVGDAEYDKFVSIAYIFEGFILVFIFLYFLTKAFSSYNLLRTKLNNVRIFADSRLAMESQLDYFIDIRKPNNLNFWLQLREQAKRTQNTELLAFVAMALIFDIVLLLAAFIRILVNKQDIDLFSALCCYDIFLLSLFLIMFLLMLVQINSEIGIDQLKLVQRIRHEMQVDLFSSDIWTQLIKTIASINNAANNQVDLYVDSWAEGDQFDIDDEDILANNANNSNEQNKDSTITTKDGTTTNTGDKSVTKGGNSSNTLNRQSSVNASSYDQLLLSRVTNFASANMSLDKFSVGCTLLESSIRYMQTLDKPITILGLVVNQELLLKVVGIMAGGAASAVAAIIPK